MKKKHKQSELPPVSIWIKEVFMCKKEYWLSINFGNVKSWKCEITSYSIVKAIYKD